MSVLRCTAPIQSLCAVVAGYVHWGLLLAHLDRPVPALTLIRIMPTVPLPPGTALPYTAHTIIRQLNTTYSSLLYRETQKISRGWSNRAITKRPDCTTQQHSLLYPRCHCTNNHSFVFPWLSQCLGLTWWFPLLVVRLFLCQCVELFQTCLINILHRVTHRHWRTTNAVSHVYLLQHARDSRPLRIPSCSHCYILPLPFATRFFTVFPCRATPVVLCWHGAEARR